MVQNMTNKEKIISIFHINIKGRSPDVSGLNERHDGRAGHWLESQFGIVHNADNKPDLFGYELKNQTTSHKTSFGDWSANEYIFNDPAFSAVFTAKTAVGRRDRFLEIFGKPNIEKGGRFSWSGEPCPKIDKYNKFGQRLIVTANNDIIAEYSYSQDLRPNKDKIVPDILQQENLQLALWYGSTVPNGKRGKCIKDKLEDKFNKNGWFTCKTNKNGVYEKICFGLPMTFDNWITLVKRGIVFFDSGMYQGNKRPYSQWRANNNYWDSLIIETAD